MGYNRNAKERPIFLRNGVKKSCCQENFRESVEGVGEEARGQVWGGGEGWKSIELSGDGRALSCKRWWALVLGESERMVIVENANG